MSFVCGSQPRNLVQGEKLGCPFALLARMSLIVCMLSKCVQHTVIWPTLCPSGFDNDGHKPWQPQTMTTTATNHDDQLGEIYPTMLNELNCTFGISMSRFHCWGRHGHGCGRHGIGPYLVLWQPCILHPALQCWTPCPHTAFLQSLDCGMKFIDTGSASDGTEKCENFITVIRNTMLS